MSMSANQMEPGTSVPVKSSVASVIMPMPKLLKTVIPEIPGPHHEEIGRYLEKSGVMESLAVAFASLYEEPKKVSNPRHYLANQLMRGIPSELEIESLRAEKEFIQKQIEDLKIVSEDLSNEIRVEKDWLLAAENEGDEEEEEGEGEGENFGDLFKQFEDEGEGNEEELGNYEEEGGEG